MKSEFFLNNRSKLVEQLKGGLIILSAYGAVQRSNDAAFRFEQEANFWYLCGIDEPEWTLVMDGSNNQTWLIMPDINEIHRIFDGGMSAEAATTLSGIGHVITTDEGLSLMRALAQKHPLVYTVGAPQYADHFNFSLNPAIQKNWALLERTFNRVQDCRKELNGLRAIKQTEELEALQRSVDITTKAFGSIKGRFTSYKNEYQIEADLAHASRFAGADGCAYDSIVAAGKNACTLHYDKNDMSIKSRQLVLMDMGAQYQRYAADITRTYAKGEPTKRQREVHVAVESAHHQIISLLGPMVSVESYQAQVDVVMSNALSSIGLDSSPEGLRKYFPHAISHGLGIDVHDSLGAPKYFQENMVLTVEPGIYIPEEGIGVRIEDDILITATGRKNLSGKLSTGL